MASAVMHSVVLGTDVVEAIIVVTVTGFEETLSGDVEIRESVAAED